MEEFLQILAQPGAKPRDIEGRRRAGAKLYRALNQEVPEI